MRTHRSFWLSMATVIFLLAAITYVDRAGAEPEVRYCKVIGSEEIIVVTAPNNCPPGTTPL